MKANFTFKIKTAIKAFVLSFAVFGIGESAKAQAPLQGGATYYVNGIGVDLVSPKDTFVNLSGTYTGTAYVTPYTTTTGIISALNLNGLDSTTTGAITIILSPGYVGIAEPNQVIVGATIGGFPYQSANKPITLKPTSGYNFTITTSSAVTGFNSVLRFNGAQFFTIDGQGTTGQRNITIQSPNGSNQTTTKVIDIIPTASSGCQSITIKNCNVVGYSDVNTVYNYGIYLGSATTGATAAKRSQGITILNNNIRAVQYGIYFLGSTLGQDFGLNVSNNTIGGQIAPGGSLATDFLGGVSGAAGILLSGQANASVNGNVIRNSIQTFGGFRAIALTAASGVYALDSNMAISGNNIYNINAGLLAPIGSGSFGIRMSLGTHTQALGIFITNNTIANITAATGLGSFTSYAYPIGISIEDVSANVGLSIINNSINLYGASLAGNGGNGTSACIVTGASVSGGIVLQNNILANRMGRDVINNVNFSTVTYDIIVNHATANPFTVINNNNYYANTFEGGYSFFGYGAGTPRVSLTHWQAFTGQDNNSITAIPSFLSDTLLQLTSATPSAMSNAGAFSSAVYTDILGVTRSTSTPSIGAYEFASNPSNINIALVGGAVYGINGTNAWPTASAPTVGSFSNMSEAIRYLNAYGTSGTGVIKLELRSTYTNEGTRYMPAIIDYPNASVNRLVTITTASGVADTLTIPNQTNFPYCSVLRFMGARFVTVDGVNKNLTILMPPNATNSAARVISINPSNMSSSTDITITNCIITGNSDVNNPNTFAGIFLGSYLGNSSALRGLNNNHTFTNNLIQAVRNGIYMRGMNAVGVQNQNIFIGNNTVGGTIAPAGSLPTTYVGNSATSHAGIYLKSVAASIIDGNTIRNNVATSSNIDFRGIDIADAAEAGKDSLLFVRNNKIYNITSTGFGCSGIRISLSDTLRSITLSNNFIGKIQATGITNYSLLNPAGIIIQSSSTNANIGVQLYYNTIQLSGSTLSASTGSACLYIDASITGGVTLVNNLFINKLGRTTGTATASYSYAITAQTTINPFTGSLNNNIYYSSAPNTTTNAFARFNGVDYTTLSTWKSITTKDAGSYLYNPEFPRDTMPDVKVSTAGPVNYGAVVVPFIISDIYGTSRFGSAGYSLSPAGTTPCVGAVEFAQPYSALTGGSTYYINGTQNPPLKTSASSGSFATVNRAIQYLNANGVDVGASVNPITLLITTGYIGEGDTLISPLNDYLNMSANRVVTLKSDAVRTITTLGVSAPYINNSSIMRFSGGAYFTIDGSINGTNSRDLTFALPASVSDPSVKIIDFIPGNVASKYITIKNCNIVGNSTSLVNGTFAGIYSGGTINGAAVPPTATDASQKGTNANSFTNNFIGGTEYGIYLRGLSTAAGLQDSGNVIRGNSIGNSGTGTLSGKNFFGGATSAAGIYLSAQRVALVDSNTVSNNLPTFSLNRGIELGAPIAALGTDTGVVISRNNIYSINSTASNSGSYGIYVNLAGTTSRNNTIVNNWISGISATGATSGGLSINNPAGICVDGTGTINNYGINIWFNSINLKTGTTISNINSASSCVAFGSSIKSGVNLQNNILQNRSAFAGSINANAVSVLVGANQNIFSNINSNDYFVNATGATNNLMAYNATTTPVYLNTIQNVQGFTFQDTTSINFVVSNFVSDTVLDIPLFSTSVLANYGTYNSAISYTSVPADIFNRVRSLSPTIGAVEFTGTPIDSVAPRLYSYTNTQCGTGPFFVIIRANEKNRASDTLYYKVNGGAVLTLQATTVAGIQRTYVIPTQPANSLILFRVSMNDASGANGKYPSSGNWDTIATIVANYPYGYGFDGPNINKWTIQQVSGNGGWIMGSYGSLSNPNFASAYSGVKMAMFPAASLATGTASRLVSPCFDLSTMVLPTLRFWVSQNADLPNQRDSIIVKINYGFGWVQVGTVARTNPNFIFPGWRQIDVCLASYSGSPALQVGIEGYSVNGNNILIDSVMMIDNFVNTSITPKTQTICGYDSISLNIASSIPGMAYSMFYWDPTIPIYSQISNEYIGNGGALTLKAANPNVDSLMVKIQVRNTLDPNNSCSNLMFDTAKVNIKLFKNGPFVTQGTPYTGAFNAGSNSNPDGAKVGDTLTYTIVPPSGLTNADYGTKWTITNTSIRTITQRPASSAVFTPPTSTTAGKYVMTTASADRDSVFYMFITFRLLPTNCDSAVLRVIKVTSSPIVVFTNGVKDTACAGATVNFVYVTPSPAANTPYIYAWDFGDSTTSTNSSVPKVYTKSGTYTVKLTVTNNASLSTTTSKTFTVLVAPKSGFTNSKPCSGDTVVFTNSTTGGLTNLWNYTSVYGTGTSTAANPHFYLSTPTGDTGTFYVRLVATNSLGCTDTTNKIVQLFAKPHAVFSIANHCLGSLATFVNGSTIAGTTNSFGSVWYPGNGDTILSYNPTYRYKTNGSYTMRLVVTSNYGCIDSASQSLVVYDKPRSGFTYDTTTTCQYVGVNLNNTTTFAAGSSKVVYLWNFGDNTVPSAAFIPNKTYGVMGTYNITLFATDTIHFCTDSTVKAINITETPIAQFESPIVGCVNTAVPFVNRTSFLSGNKIAYAWQFGDGGADTAANPNHTYLNAASDTVTLTAVAISGCKSSQSKVITILPSPAASFTSAKVATDNYSFDFYASNHTYASYVWNTGDGNIYTSYRDTIRHLFNVKGKHAVTLTVTDIAGCSASHTDTVQTITAPGIASVSSSQFGVNVYPNPFTDVTNVSYTLINNAKVNVKVFDMLGRMVADIDNGTQSAGNHVTELNADKLTGSSAVYLVRVQIDESVITKQIIRQK